MITESIVRPLPMKCPRACVAFLGVMLISLCAVSARAQTLDLSSGLAGYWQFDTVNGTTTPDSSGQGNTGTLLNSPTLVPGKFGNALQFDNSINGSSVSTALPFGSPTWSLSLWLNPVNPIPTTDPYNGLLTFLSADPNRQLLGLQKDGVYMYTTRVAQYNFEIHSGWHHVVLTYDGAVLSAVVDNRSRGSLPLPNILASATTKRLIGSVGTSKHSFKGAIDEVRLYNRVLNGREISALFTPSNPPPAPTPLSVTKTWPPAQLPSWTGYTHIALNASREIWCRAANGPGVSFEQMPEAVNATASKVAKLNIIQVESGRSYTRYIRCVDTDGNPLPSEMRVDFSIDADIAAPEIRELSASAVRGDSAEIVWTTTEPATSRVELSGPSGQSSISEDASYSYSHAQLFTGLVPNTSYSYQAISADRAGNRVVSARGSFTTRPSPGITLYVDPNGNDSNLGTSISAPLATLDRARDIARVARPIPAGGIQISIRRGTYPRLTPLTLTSADSGTATAPLRFVAYNGEEVRISGGKELTGKFTPLATSSALYNRFDSTVRSKIYQVDLKAPGIGITDYGTRQNSGAIIRTVASPLEFFFQDERMTLARWPNKNPLDPYSELSKIVAVPDPTKTFVSADERPGRWQSFADVWVHGNWFFNHRHSVLKTTSIVKESTGGYRITAPGDLTGMKINRPFFYFNVPEELDAPGEWYLDRDTGILYFYPPADINSGRAFVSLASNLVTFTGATNTIFSGIIFEHARYRAVDMNRDSAFNMIENSIIRNAAVGANIAGKHNGIWGGKIYNIEDNGVALYGGKTLALEGGYNFVEGAEIYNFATLNKSYRAAVNLTASDMFITTDPLGPSQGVSNRVRFNKIHHGPHYGIIAHGNNYLIEGNEVASVCAETIDCGAIYLTAPSPRRGTMVRYNYVHDIYGFDFERIYTLNAVALYLDNDQSGTSMYGNIIDHVDVGLLMNGGRDNTFENNLVSNSDEPMHLNSAGLNITAKNFRIPIAEISDSSPVVITTIRPHGNEFVYETNPSTVASVVESAEIPEINGTWGFEVINKWQLRLIGTQASGAAFMDGLLIQNPNTIGTLEKYNYLNPPFATSYPRLTRALLEVDDAESKGNRIERNAFYANTVQEFDRMYVGGRTNPSSPSALTNKFYIPIGEGNLTDVQFSITSLDSYNFSGPYAAGLKQIPVDRVGLISRWLKSTAPPSPPTQVIVVK